MNNLLFDEFTPVSSKQWKQKIQFDLKGADYNDTLVCTSNEGIQVKPFYHADDIKALPLTTNSSSEAFKVCEIIDVVNAKIANTNALTAIESGAESIKFVITSEAISPKILLDSINLDDTSVFIELEFLSEAYVKAIYKHIANYNIKTNLDIIGKLAKTGNWYSNLTTDFLEFKNSIEISKSFSINVALYQNAGANIVQQLAYAMAHTNEYFNYIEQHITHKNPLTSEVVFNIAVGSNYFFEIAKLRVLRLLFNAIQNEYTHKFTCHIFATPSKRNKGIYDYNTNMLRTTTECMSAVLGGANTICNLAYDAAFNKTNDFGNRIARNQLLILKHESYFDKVNNASDGSYYIESLTHQLAEKALILFKNIETNGGFLKQLKSGTIQRKIKENAAKEEQLFTDGDTVILGSNKYPNPNDKMKDSLELYPFVKIKKRKTLIEPILEKRLTENLEQQRLKKE